MIHEVSSRWLHKIQTEYPITRGSLNQPEWQFLNLTCGALWKIQMIRNYENQLCDFSISLLASSVIRAKQCLAYSHPIEEYNVAR